MLVVSGTRFSQLYLYYSFGRKVKDMGISGISPWSLLLILAIVLVLFGTKRLRTLGKDLGEAIQGFKKGMEEEPAEETTPLENKADDKNKTI